MTDITDISISNDGILSFHLVTATIGAIRIGGNQRVSVDTIQQQIPFKVGDFYSRSQVSEAANKIQMLPGVLECTATNEPTGEAGKLAVVFRVNEKVQ